MKKRIIATIMAVVAGSLCLMSFVGCDGESTTTGTSGGSTKSDKKDYGGYDKEYWDAARDAWDANT